jgi:hypothetical protein
MARLYTEIRAGLNARGAAPGRERVHLPFIWAAAV